MFEKFEAIGIWWLPDNPEKKVRGTLFYSPETGAVLQLMGSFEEIDDATHHREYDIINGYAGGKITLHKCFTKSFTTAFPFIYLGPETITTTYYRANFIFKGHFFKNASEIQFKYARVNYNNLGSWFSLHTISHSISAETGNLTITTKTIAPIPVEIKDNLKISLISTENNSGRWENDGLSYSLREKKYVDFETSNPINLDEFMKNSQIIQHFLTLATNQPIIIQSLSILISEEGEGEINVDVFFIIQEHLLEKDKLIHPSEMLFSYNDISIKFGRILKIWFEKSSFLGPIFNLYFALRYNDKVYVEHKFLNLVSCLESYHRRKFNGRYHLKDRIALICSNNDSISSKYIANQDDFVRKVDITRNYRTHLERQLEGQAIVEIEEYLDFNVKLKLLVELCILKELDFSSDEIKAMFRRNREYERIHLPSS